MTDSDKKFSGEVVCRHCGNASPMEIVSEYALPVPSSDPRLPNLGTDYYEILKCPACRGISFRTCYYDGFNAEGINYSWLYPTGVEVPLGLPPNIERLYVEAQKVKLISTDAYGCLLGKILEAVCFDKGAKKTRLEDQIEYLVKAGEIPKHLDEIAQKLRRFRNFGVHIKANELTPREIPLLDKLCRAVVEYVYSAPLLAQEAQVALEKLESNL